MDTISRYVALYKDRILLQKDHQKADNRMELLVYISVAINLYISSHLTGGKMYEM